jgi:PadR family transcriptional regulator, regulatory protein PadR
VTCVTPIVTPVAEKLSRPVSEAVARGRRPERGEDTGRHLLGQEVRRRDLVPALVLHLMRNEPVYGNRIMKGIEELTEGVLSVNPNTIYPLLRSLEERGLIEGAWEHPDRRTRRFYSVTPGGLEELERLRSGLEPILDSAIRSMTLIKAELYDDAK